MPTFVTKNGKKKTSIAAPLLNVLEQCGFNVSDLGNTYNADHAQSNGNISESALDHVYCSKTIVEHLVYMFRKFCILRSHILHII